MYGRDPNWGRIACAAGYAGVPFNPEQLNIRLGHFELMDKGQPIEFDRQARSTLPRCLRRLQRLQSDWYATLRGFTEQGGTACCLMVLDSDRFSRTLRSIRSDSEQVHESCAQNHSE